MLRVEPVGESGVGGGGCQRVGGGGKKCKGGCMFCSYIYSLHSGIQHLCVHDRIMRRHEKRNKDASHTTTTKRQES